jgi:excisionase family DNA binding protein
MTNHVMRVDDVAPAHGLPRATTRRTPLRRTEAATYVQDVRGQPCTAKTLAKLAVVCGGPPYRKAGKYSLYDLNDLDAWAQARLSPRVFSSSEPPGQSAASLGRGVRLGSAADRSLTEMSAVAAGDVDTVDTITYSPRQAARVTGRSHPRIKKAIRERELTARKDGRATLIERAELQRWIAAMPTIGRKPEPTTALVAAKDGARTTPPPRPRSIARLNGREETRR